MKLNGTLFAGIAALALVAPSAASAQDLRAGVAEDMPEIFTPTRN